MAEKNDKFKSERQNQKKRKKRSSKSTRNQSINNQSSDSSKKSSGLSSFSYADFVLLSSLIAYSISEELNNEDLRLFIIFLELVLADLGLLVLQKELQQENSTIINENIGEEVEEDIFI